jgi:hypothetical protein
MKRQVGNTTTRVYQYGSIPARIAPVKNEDAALFQMRLGQRLWNTLVAIERTRVAAYRRIMANENQQRADAIALEIEDIRTAIKSARQSARSLAVDMGDIPDRLKALKAERAEIIEQLKATKADRIAERKAQLDAIQERSYTRVKRARQAAGRMGLFWGSYNDIVQRADAGKKLGELQFRGFRNEGTVTAQIIGGASETACVGGSHTFFQVDSAKLGQKWRYARMRIGSNADRSPVWLEIPIVYHRNIPADAQIKSVSATRRIVAGKVRWSLNVTCTVQSVAPKQHGAVIAVDIGWRLLPHGVRVAFWSDSAGEFGEVVVPTSDIDQFGKVRSLLSICDKTREELVPMLAAWMNGQKDRLPEEWAKRSVNLIQWRSSGRLDRLIGWWRDNRLSGDVEIFTAAIEWRKQYLHLIQWARNLQEQMKLRLREQYRVFGAKVANQYTTLVVEQFDIREVAKKPPAESEEVITASSTYRQIVSPSMFRAALVNAAKREGVAIIKAPAEYTTRTCNQCLSNRAWDQVPSVIHTCQDCGAMWDQDDNAAKNLLRLANGEAVKAAE